MVSDIIHLVQLLAAAHPITSAKVASATGAVLQKADENNYFVIFNGGGSALADGTVIRDVDARIPKPGHVHSGFVSLQISGRCLTKRELERVFGRMALIEAPRGRTKDEQLVFSASIEGAEIRFGFSGEKADCVATIGVLPASPR